MPFGPFGQTPLFMGFSRKNTGVGCHFLLQGIFLTRGLNLNLLCLLQCRPILSPHTRSLEAWVSFSRPPLQLGSSHRTRLWVGHVAQGGGSSSCNKTKFQGSEGGNSTAWGIGQQWSWRRPWGWQQHPGHSSSVTWLWAQLCSHQACFSSLLGNVWATHTFLVNSFTAEISQTPLLFLESFFYYYPWCVCARSSLWHTRSLVAACRLLVAACGI